MSGMTYPIPRPITHGVGAGGLYTPTTGVPNAIAVAGVRYDRLYVGGVPLDRILNSQSLYGSAWR